MTTKGTAPSIIWPENYLPGTTDNFVSNEVITTGIPASRIWDLLDDISKWESYYDNVGQITPPESGTRIKKGDYFSFSTFGLPPLQTQCWESVAPEQDTVGRLGWRRWREGSKEEAVDAYHAWLIEDLEDGRVRVLTQESQIGQPAARLAVAKPHPMLSGHQDWLNGLVEKAAWEEKL